MAAEKGKEIQECNEGVGYRLLEAGKDSPASRKVHQG